MTQLTLEQAFAVAVREHQAGRWGRAEELYRQILAQQPNHVDSLHLLGVLLHQLGQNEPAVMLIHRAVALRPNWPEAFSNLGEILRKSGDLDGAIAAGRRAVALRPGYAEAYSNLGNALKQSGQWEQAVGVFQKAIALKPNYADAWYNCGTALQAGGKAERAIAAYERAAELKPDYWDAYYNLGILLQETGKLDEALIACRRAIALRPEYAEAHNNLGAALREKGRLDDAMAAFRRAIALRPEYPEAHNNLGNVLKDKARLPEAIAEYRIAIALKPDYVTSHSNLLLAMHYHPECDAHSIAEEHRRWNRQHAQPLQHLIQPHTNDPDPDRRLRIGYVSSDFQEHPVGRFLLPLLANHDKGQVEVFGYSGAKSPDSLTQALRGCTDGWRDIAAVSDARAAELIREDRIDLLIDLSMHSSGNRLLVFARKPAPVQATYLAYCSTTGLETIDYRLSDPYLDPAQTQSFYSEETVHLPETYWCYQPVISPAIGPLPALARGQVTFGCLNSICKVSQSALASWARILSAVPQSRIILHAQEGEHRTEVVEKFNRLGIEPHRVQFAGRMPLGEYLQSYQQIDIGLDPFPFAGGTTTCDALYMGVPVVSLAGPTGVGRGGLSILSNIGLPELAAATEQQYVRIATELAMDTGRLAQLRSTLRQRMEQSPLMDAPKFARQVEAVYRKIWRRWCEDHRA